MKTWDALGIVVLDVNKYLLDIFLVSTQVHSSI